MMPLATPHRTISKDAAALRLDGICKDFGGPAVLQRVSVDLPAGKLSVLLGPSGCGKSILLRLIAGLDYPTAGVIRLGDADITDQVPAKRNLAMVFQSYALFPHMSVAENILFGLSVRRVPQREQWARLERVAGLMSLTPLLGRKPGQLSGGQQQRVALARAVVEDGAMMGSGGCRRGGYSTSFALRIISLPTIWSIDRCVDLAGVRRDLAPVYSAIERPSIDPELLIQMMIVVHCFSIRSERRLCQETHLNLA